MTIDPFQQSLTKSEKWVHELTKALGAADDHMGLKALRAGLHAIRDRLPAIEVVELGAQLPMLIRGLYYEGWTLRNDPTSMRTREEMVERVSHYLRDTRLDADSVLRAVIRVLGAHVSEGELKDVVATLPGPIADLWRESMA